MSKKVFILGGYQTDFALNYKRAGKDLYDLLQDSVIGAFEQTDIAPNEVESAHIGNFVGELFCGQGQLGGMFVSIHPDLAGIPTARHEAACASGSMAAFNAMAEIEAGRYDLVCVSGIEMMRNVSGKEDVRWFEADPCFIYHVVNAWEEGDEIIMDTCVTINPTPQKEYANAMEKLNAYLRLEANVKRYRFNLKTGETKEHWVDDAFTEFPLINSRFTGHKSRYSYIQHFDNSTIMRFDGVVKYDTEKDSSQTHWYGEGKFGSESPFIPAENGREEDEGYIISFVSDEREGTSEAIILDAQNIEKAPLARIKMPQRVPLGFHACWVNGDRLFS